VITIIYKKLAIFVLSLIILILLFNNTIFFPLKNFTNVLAIIIISPPQVEVSPNQIVADENTNVILSGNAKDNDTNDKLEYHWRQENTDDAPFVNLRKSNTLNPEFKAPQVTSDTVLKFSLKAIDSMNTESNIAVVTVIVKDVNHPPIAKTISNLIINEGHFVSLDASESNDPDNDPITFSWTQKSGIPVELADAQTAIPSFQAPQVTSDTILKFSLTVKDDKGMSSLPVTVDITVKNVNHPPVANAGYDRVVNAGKIVYLDASESNDPDNDPITFSWTQKTGPDVTINGSKENMASFITPSNIKQDTEIIFNVIVTDSKNASNSDSMKVIVKYIPPPNQPPIANAGEDQIVNSGDKVTLNGEASRDLDRDILSYIWKQIDTDKISINLTNPYNARSSFNTPSNLDSNITLRFELTVKDGKSGISSDKVEILVKSSKAEAIKYTSKGVELKNLGNYTGAIEQYDKALAIDPKHVNALNNKGNVLFKLERYREAIEQYDKVLAIDPKHVNALNGKGNALNGLARYTEAIEYFDKALAIDPKYVKVLFNKGLALDKLERYTEAIEYYDKVLDINPKHVNALNDKGSSLLKLDNYTGAIEQYDKALAIDPKYVYALFNKGLALDKLERYAEAIEQYDKALAIDPKYVKALYNKGVDLHKLDNYTGAIEQYDKVLAIDPKYVYALTDKGLALDKLERYAEAIEQYDKALAIDPKYVKALYNKGVDLHKLDNYTGAIEQYDKVLDINPKHVNALKDKGFALNRLDNYTGAIEYFDKALAIDPKDVWALCGKGRALNYMERYTEAIEQFDKALEADPNNLCSGVNKISAKLNLEKKGRDLYESKRYTEAIEYFDRALEIDPKFVKALTNKGLALSKLDNYTGAIEYYDKALAIDPKNVKALNNKGLALFNLERYRTALVILDKALDIDPQNEYALNLKDRTVAMISNTS
jgi:tetratricopeptide (TPR) repeat protein